jgi:hypothetical protein
MRSHQHCDQVFINSEDDTATHLPIESIAQESARHAGHVHLLASNLTINLVSLGVVPRQNTAIPSSRNILEAQWNELRYSVLALSDCMRVLILSSGMVVSGNGPRVPPSVRHSM